MWRFKTERGHLQQNWSKTDDLVHLRQLLLRLISHLVIRIVITNKSYCYQILLQLDAHRRVYRALQQLRQRLHVHSEIRLPPSSETIQVTLAAFITSVTNAWIKSREKSWANKNRPTITSHEIQTAERLLLPRELAKHAVSSQTSAACTLFQGIH